MYNLHIHIQNINFSNSNSINQMFPIEINEDDKLRDFSKLQDGIKSVTCKWCNNLVSLESLANYATSLEYLHISYCSNLTVGLPDLFFPRLKYLKIWNAKMQSINLAPQVNLVELVIHAKLTSIESFLPLTQLVILDLAGNKIVNVEAL